MVKPGFGKRILRARLKIGISRTQLALKVKVTSTSIGNFETGRRRPKWKVLARIAKALKTSEHYLITGRKSVSFRKAAIDDTYSLIRSMVHDKRTLDGFERMMQRCLNARLRFS